MGMVSDREMAEFRIRARRATERGSKLDRKLAEQILFAAERPLTAEGGLRGGEMVRRSPVACHMRRYRGK